MYVHLYVYVGVCISYVLVLIVIRFVDSEEAFGNFGVAEKIYREKLPYFEFSYFDNELSSEGSKSKDCLTRYFLLYNVTFLLYNVTHKTFSGINCLCNELLGFYD